MFRILAERLKQGYRTLDWPRKEPALSPRYRGRPLLADTDCADCRACYAACPAGALLGRPDAPGRTPVLDMGRCIFCGACADACPERAIRFSGDYRVAAATREALLVHPQAPGAEPEEPAAPDPAALLGGRFRLFRRSLKLREVSAGGCNACEADTNVLGTLVYDLGRFGIEFTASPRHADGLVVTGPVTRNMCAALIDTWAAVPRPRLLVAVGACAISGGLFREAPESLGGLGGTAEDARPGAAGAADALTEAGLTPDIYVPGCPPNPWSILAGILALRGH
ncbi:4Fe-4S dicluster domain-containing protein [Desulfovibrio sp.]|uniref:NADH-quinone oxidoreductase subunit B family protein n=1 Tax=Desulfovibrio sp. TaxID=885 RepID=UPI0023CAD909|nr:4Fe-4S dicluster domain-containing protein [Desulfovibrio sp.]MDE7240976.1 4Fe-4S dicluster domain-containing protein [Desulfovibrio sp.]